MRRCGRPTATPTVIRNGADAERTFQARDVLTEAM
jgi:hypothetical protein